MEYTQITLDEWVGMKESLKKDLIGVQESFVRIGYTLRKIEEQELYKQDGYKTIAEFAKTEYGLGPSTVSRFININKKYSIGGYSDQLRHEFANLGSSKLSEMLALPEQDMEMIKPEATKEDIRELKRFNKEDGQENITADMKDVIKKFFQENPQTLNDIYSSEAYETEEVEALIDLVNPSGSRTFRKGLYFMMMYEGDIKIKQFGQTPGTMSWAEFFAITREIFDEAAAKDKTWQKYFGESEEEDAAEEGRTLEENEKSREEKKTEIERLEEPETAEENITRTEVIEQRIGSRREYMAEMDNMEIAKYINKETERGNLSGAMLRVPGMISAWLDEKVDENGKEIVESKHS